jgi:hypothetical protein
MQSHFRLDQKQRGLVAELKALLPAGATTPRKATFPQTARTSAPPPSA